MYKIEKNVSKTKKSKYPFEEMEVGDSFLIKCKNGEIHKHRTYLHLAIKRLKDASGNRSMNISTRRVDGGLRVWLDSK